MPTTAHQTGSAVRADFDLHGIVGIRVIGGSAADVAAVERQLGPIRSTMERTPDITIRFVDRLATTSRVRLLGKNEAGFTDDAFLVMRGKHKSVVRAQIPFEQIGGPCEIVCETGLPAVPLLIPIVNYTALANGALPLHAAALEYGGTGAIATGWSKGGKTETLLAFLTKGATYIGDEWVYISGDGAQMFGIPEPVRVWDWHLEHLPGIRRKVGAKHRAKLRAVRSLQASGAFLQKISGRSMARQIQRVLAFLEKQAHVDVRPDRLCGGKLGAMQGSFDRLIFVESHESPETTVEQISADEVADRMQFSLQYERFDLAAYYAMFRFAFPNRRNEFLEQAHEIQKERLRSVMSGKPTWRVGHPYPVPIPELFDAIEPLLRSEQRPQHATEQPAMASF